MGRGFPGFWPAMLGVMFTGLNCGSGFTLPDERNIPYADGHSRQVLDLYLPGSADPPFPVVVWIHGGGWEYGDKWDAVMRAPALLNRGIAVAAIHYRLSDQAMFPAQIQDCKAAVRWLRAHAESYRLDEARIGAWGISAGGHLAALLGTTGGDPALEGSVGEWLSYSSDVQAVADYNGPAKLVDASFAEMVTSGHRVFADLLSFYVTKLLGLMPAGSESAEAAAQTPAGRESWSNVMDLGRSASPLEHVTSDDPPFFIAHGTADPLVPWEQSRKLADALEEAGVPCVFRTVTGAGHTLPPSLDFEVAEFFDRELRGGP